jgi:hypothetical protein
MIGPHGHIEIIYHFILVHFFKLWMKEEEWKTCLVATFYQYLTSLVCIV